MDHFIERFLHYLFVDSIAWSIFGWIAQGMFAGSFLIQWLASEKRKESVVPVAFWYVRTIGALLLTVYTIHVWKMPLIAGSFFSFLVCTRNLMIIRAKEKRDLAAAIPDSEKIIEPILEPESEPQAKSEHLSETLPTAAAR
ncbi:MAG: lipid-A-disaccharide synthase N-terminal domain-containing protein [Verrucomicrobiales bacterium]